MTKSKPCSSLSAQTAAAVAGAIVLLAAAATASAADGWPTDAKRAIADARKSNRIILMNFTGSDWCPYCIRLEKEIFSTREFKRWADDNVVLLELDFPRGKGQSTAVKRQNAELAKKYSITGYPTVLLVDAEGNVLGKAGYVAGGPTNWIKNIEPLVQAKKVKVEPMTSLPRGLELAKAFGRPMLLIADPKSDPAVTDLFRNGELAELAKAQLIIVHLKGKQPADAEKALKELRIAKKLPEDETFVAAIDPAKDEALYSEAGIPAAGKLVGSLRNVLPKLTYSGEWLEDFAKAECLAEQLGRPMLLMFTSSDTSPICIKLDKEIICTDAFKEFANDKVVLVKVDFLSKTQQPEELKKQNMAVARKFGVSGQPMFVCVAPDGKKVGNTNYVAGTAEALIQKLKELVDKWSSSEKK